MRQENDEVLRAIRAHPRRAFGFVYLNPKYTLLEGVGGLGSLLEQVPVDLVLFGSHVPLLYFESAQLKLSELALTPDQRRAVCHRNARRLLAGTSQVTIRLMADP